MEDMHLELYMPRGKICDNKNRIEFIKCFLGKDTNIQEDINPFENTVLLTVIKEEERVIIKKEFYEILIKCLNKIQENDKMISCNEDYNNFIKKLFSGHNIKFKKIHDSILYYEPSRIPIIKLRFLKKLLDIFKEDIVYSRKINLDYYLNLKRISTPHFDLENSVEEVVDKIYNSQKKDNYYIVNNDTDRKNIERINKGLLPRFYYFQGTVESKYNLILSLMKVNNDNNLPTNTIHKILRNLKLDDEVETFNYYYYKLVARHKKIENFQKKTFKNIEEALSYSMDLEKLGIRGILIEDRNLYTICYHDKKNIPFFDNLENNKLLIIEKLKNLTTDDYIYDNYSIFELLNIQIYNKTPILLEDKTLVPDYELIQNKGYRIYNLKGSLLDFSSKNYMKFNRDNFFINININIDIIEKIDTYYSIAIEMEDEKFIIEKDFYIPRKEKDFKIGLLTVFEKGYLISDTGLMRYISENTIKKEDIFLPDWFKSDSEEEFIFLLNFITNIK